MPDSTKRFPDGAHYRIEIPSVEGPKVLAAVLDKAAKVWRYEVAKKQHVPVPLSFNGPEKPVAGKVGWSDDTVWIDAVKPKKGAGDTAVAGTVGFHGVPAEVWNFNIGGYPVCEKWLKILFQLGDQDSPYW